MCVSCNSGLKVEIGDPSPNSSWNCLIYTPANSPWKGLNPSPPPSYLLNSRTCIWKKH